MRVLAVTGVPGTGKSTIAKRIAKIHRYDYLDVSLFIKRNKIYDGYDAAMKSYIVDTKKLNKALVTLIQSIKKENKEMQKTKLKNKSKKMKKGIVIDSHLSHYLPKKYVDICVVTKCDIQKLELRLKKRKYSRKKIRENIDSEIFDVCLVEATEKGHRVKIVDTTKRVLNNDLQILK